MTNKQESQAEILNILNPNFSILTIDSSNQKDFGHYVCTSLNTFGTAEISLKISQNGIEIADSSTYKPVLVSRKYAKYFKRKFPTQNIGLELRKRRFRKRFKFSKLRKPITDSS